MQRLSNEESGCPYELYTCPCITTVLTNKEHDVPKRGKNAALKEYVLTPSPLKIPCDFGLVSKARHFFGWSFFMLFRTFAGVCLAAYPRIHTADPLELSIGATLWHYSKFIMYIILYVEYMGKHETVLSVLGYAFTCSLFCLSSPSQLG